MTRPISSSCAFGGIFHLLSDRLARGDVPLPTLSSSRWAENRRSPSSSIAGADGVFAMLVSNTGSSGF